MTSESAGFLPGPWDGDWLEGPGATSESLPRLDYQLNHGVTPYSLSFLLATLVVEEDDRARHYADKDPAAAARHSERAIGMMLAYNIVAGVVISGEDDPSDAYVYDEAIAEVRAAVQEARSYWDPQVPPLERYFRLTQAQKFRPDLTDGLVRLRARALAETLTGEAAASAETLAASTGLTVDQVRALLRQADPGAGNPGYRSRRKAEEQ